MSSHPPRRKDASLGGLLGTVLPLVYSAHLGSCTKVTASQFNHLCLGKHCALKQKGKIYKQASAKTRHLETLQELEVVRRFLRQQPTKCPPPGLLPLLSCTIPSSKVGAIHSRKLWACGLWTYTSPFPKDWKGQLQAGPSPTQPVLKVKCFVSAIIRHFMLKERKRGHTHCFWWAL